MFEVYTIQDMVSYVFQLNIPFCHDQRESPKDQTQDALLSIPDSYIES